MVIEIVNSPRTDYCGRCKKDHGYDCPYDPVKDYNLKKGDVVVADGIEYTYIKTDGMYSKWSTKYDDWVTGNFGELELGEDGKYRPI